MPYCCRCGNQVATTDFFCRACGTKQPAPEAERASVPPPDLVPGMSARTATLLCYIPVIGWIGAIIVLASPRFRREWRVRFNAFQGLYLFVAWLIVDWALSPMLSFAHFGPGPGLLKLIIFVTWIFMIVKVSHGELYKLPILGDLAEKSVSEQRL